MIRRWLLRALDAVPAEDDYRRRYPDAEITAVHSMLDAFIAERTVLVGALREIAAADWDEPEWARLRAQTALSDSSDVA